MVGWHVGYARCAHAWAYHSTFCELGLERRSQSALLIALGTVTRTAKSASANQAKSGGSSYSTLGLVPSTPPPLAPPPPPSHTSWSSNHVERMDPSSATICKRAPLHPQLSLHEAAQLGSEFTQREHAAEHGAADSSPYLLLGIRIRWQGLLGRGVLGRGASVSRPLLPNHLRQDVAGLDSRCFVAMPTASAVGLLASGTARNRSFTRARGRILA